MIYEETMHDQQSSMLDKDKIAQANQVFAEVKLINNISFGLAL
jgi:hypothetical protein